MRRTFVIIPDPYLADGLKRILLGGNEKVLIGFHFVDLKNFLFEIYPEYKFKMPWPEEVNPYWILKEINNNEKYPSFEKTKGFIGTAISLSHSLQQLLDTPLSISTIKKILSGAASQKLKDLHLLLNNFIEFRNNFKKYFSHDELKRRFLENPDLKFTGVDNLRLFGDFSLSGSSRLDRAIISKLENLNFKTLPFPRTKNHKIEISGDYNQDGEIREAFRLLLKDDIPLDELALGIPDSSYLTPVFTSAKELGIPLRVEWDIPIKLSPLGRWLSLWVEILEKGPGRFNLSNLFSTYPSSFHENQSTIAPIFDKLTRKYRITGGTDWKKFFEALPEKNGGNTEECT
ncbi:MAG: hypothetical protein SV062_09330, partial [Thermodesulfobacteriota bacterium]|nr:hypothetical protein [Thermodesulfobacteriota bacterium]